MTPAAYDDGPSGSPPGGYSVAFPRLTPMVRWLLIVTGAAFVVQYALSFSPAASSWVLTVLGLDPRTWGRFFPFVPVWQVATYGFLHGGLSHLLYNLLLLYFFGTMLEGIVGARRFLVVYLSAMVCGAALHLAVEPLLGSGAAAIGASGAALGIMVVCAVLRPNTQVIFLFVPLPLKVLALGIIALDVFVLLEGFRRGGDNTAHYVHIGGALYGFLAARRGWIWKDPISRAEARRAIAKEERRVSDEERMDQLLAKIHDEGLNALSRSEKEFLKRMSQRR